MAEPNSEFVTFALKAMRPYHLGNACLERILQWIIEQLHQQHLQVLRHVLVLHFAPATPLIGLMETVMDVIGTKGMMYPDVRSMENHVQPKMGQLQKRIAATAS
jgi:hypothetical protein